MVVALLAGTLLVAQAMNPMEEALRQAHPHSGDILLRCAGLETAVATVLLSQEKPSEAEASRSRSAQLLAVYAYLYSTEASTAGSAASRFARDYLKSIVALDGRLSESWIAEDLSRCLSIYRKVVPKLQKRSGATHQLSTDLPKVQNRRRPRSESTQRPT